MQQTIYTCDVCGKHKQDANHWVRVLVAASGNVLTLSRWKEQRNINELDFCGSECALKKISEFLGSK